MKNNAGNNLAKVLYYYGFISGSDAPTEDKIICPFHADINPSLMYNLSDGKWFCFGCQLSGDALLFVKNMERKLTGKCNIHILKRYYEILRSKKTKPVDVGLRLKKPKGTEEDLLIAMDYYYNLSQPNWRRPSGDEDVVVVLDYMRKRGFNASTLNLCKAKITYNKSYPIIFPMMDNDEFKGYVCRTTTKAVEERRKYLYNKGFSRENTLCGSYDQNSVVYICEGYMDMLKLKSFGVKNVVAILGWKISGNQLNKLKTKNVKTVVSILDNDTCGNKGTEYLRRYFDVIRFQYSDGVKDPGDMNKKQFDQMRTLTKRKYRRIQK